MRIPSFVIGLIMGVALTLVVVQASGGWYTYVTLNRYACAELPLSAEIVPHQPNPCHYRYPRWDFLP